MGTLDPDRPHESPDDDRLDYAPFARALATSIAQMRPCEGLVIAIYGPWGSGKSTVINYVRHYLKHDGGDVLPVVFNPWWFSGQEDLTLAFFGELLAALPAKLDDHGRRRIAEFAGTVSKAGGLQPV